MAEEERTPFLSIQELTSMWRPMTQEETARAEVLLPLISDELRVRGRACGADLDAMAEEDPCYGSVLKNVTAGIIARILRQETQGEPMTQESQSALGYVWSGTYAIPGGGISGAILKNDMKALGLRRQRMGVMEPYDIPAYYGAHGPAL